MRRPVNLAALAFAVERDHGHGDRRQLAMRQDA
jgi:hypothetical protein